MNIQDFFFSVWWELQTLSMWTLHSSNHSGIWPNFNLTSSSLWPCTRDDPAPFLSAYLKKLKAVKILPNPKILLEHFIVIFFVLIHRCILKTDLSTFFLWFPDKAGRRWETYSVSLNPSLSGRLNYSPQQAYTAWRKELRMQPNPS